MYSERNIYASLRKKNGNNVYIRENMICAQLFWKAPFTEKKPLWHREHESQKQRLAHSSNKYTLKEEVRREQ